MSDFLVAVGLVFVFEGIMFAGFPAMTKRAMASTMETPESTLRTVGLVSAAIGVLAIWLVRG